MIGVRVKPHAMKASRSLFDGYWSILSYCIKLLWIRFSNRSLIYPAVALVLFGAIFVEMAHRQISGPRLEDDAEEAIIRQMMEEFKPTWMDRVTALCIIVGLVLLLIFLLR